MALKPNRHEKEILERLVQDYKKSTRGKNAIHNSKEVGKCMVVAEDFAKYLKDLGYGSKTKKTNNLLETNIKIK
jgi:hypothetical protein